MSAPLHLAHPRMAGPPAVAVAEQPSQPYEPSWLTWPDGASHSSLRSFKVYRFAAAERAGGPIVFWQVRDIVAGMGVLPRGASLAKWYKESGRPPDDAWFQSSCGVTGADWRPSRKAANARKIKDPIRLQWVQMEHTCSS